MIKAGAEVHEIPSQHVKYLVLGSHWVGYDDVTSVKEKACYAKQKGFGGVMYWSLPLDDFSGSSCNEGRYPLINSANKEFQSSGFGNCPKTGNTPFVTPVPQTPKPDQPRPPTPRPVTNKPKTLRPGLPTLPPTGDNVDPCAKGDLPFYPHPTNCHMYYQCAFGFGYVQTCPPGLGWNQAASFCDYVRNVPGCSKKRESDPEDPCAKGNLPFYPHPTDCHSYYQCANGITYQQVCPPGLGWSQDKGSCEYLAECQGGDGVDPTDPCAHGKQGFFPHPMDCNKYFQCSMGRKFEFHCPGKLVWNQALKTCDYSGSVPGCS